MRVAFRVDASYVIGSGHVMRCLTLADFLAKSGHQSLFISRDHTGNMAEHIRERGYPAVLLPGSDEVADTGSPEAAGYALWLGVSQKQDAAQTSHVLRESFAAPDWLVVDHYALDSTWHNEMRSDVVNLFVIDDLANRAHDCDMLLDHNLNDRGRSRYDGLVPDRCRRLIGPEYALLREEFIVQRTKLRTRDGSIRKVLVFFGGVDPSGEALKTCHALAAYAGTRFAITVIAGTANLRSDEVKAFCVNHGGFTFFHRVDNMAALMAEADLAFGAGGTTTWERAYLGLPTIAVWVAENQREGTEAMAMVGALWNLGRAEDITPSHICASLEQALANPGDLREMSGRAQGLFGKASEPAGQQVIRLMQESARA